MYIATFVESKNNYVLYYYNNIDIILEKNLKEFYYYSIKLHLNPTN